MDVWENLFTKRAARHWNRVPRAPPSLEVPNEPPGMALCVRVGGDGSEAAPGGVPSLRDLI